MLAKTLRGGRLTRRQSFGHGLQQRELNQIADLFRHGAVAVRELFAQPLCLLLFVQIGNTFIGAQALGLFANVIRPECGYRGPGLEKRESRAATSSPLSSWTVSSSRRIYVS